MSNKKTPKLTLVKGQKIKDRPLTAKQSGFVDSLIGKNGEEPKTIIDSYRDNYSTSGMSLNAQYVESSRLFNHPNVSLRYKMLKEEQNTLRNQSRKERVIFNLEQLAFDKENLGHSRIKSLELLGRMTSISLFSDNLKIEDTRNSQDIKEELEKKIKSLLS
jgi:hypothetical protein